MHTNRANSLVPNLNHDLYMSSLLEQNTFSRKPDVMIHLNRIVAHLGSLFPQFLCFVTCKRISNVLDIRSKVKYKLS